MKKIWSRTLRPGEKWSGNIGRGKYIHFKALGDDANVSMLMYNMLDTSERYNMPDTLKDRRGQPWMARYDLRIYDKTSYR